MGLTYGVDGQKASTDTVQQGDQLGAQSTLVTILESSRVRSQARQLSAMADSHQVCCRSE